MAALSPSREVLGRAEENLERAAGSRAAIVGISLPGPDDGGAWVDRAKRAAVVAGRDPDWRVAETADGSDDGVVAQHGSRTQGIDGTERIHAHPARDRDVVPARPSAERIGGADTPGGILEHQHVAPAQFAQAGRDGGSIEPGRHSDALGVLSPASAGEAPQDRPPGAILVGVQSGPFLEPTRCGQARLERLAR